MTLDDEQVKVALMVKVLFPFVIEAVGLMGYMFDRGRDCKEGCQGSLRIECSCVRGNL